MLNNRKVVRMDLLFSIADCKTHEEIIDIILDSYLYRDAKLLQFVLDKSECLNLNGKEYDPLRCDILEAMGE